MGRFAELRARQQTRKEIELPLSGIVVFVRPVSLLDTALAGKIPTTIMSDLEDLNYRGEQLEKAERVDGEEVMENLQEQRAFGIRLIKELAEDPEGTPEEDSIKQDHNLELLPIGDILWFLGAATRGFRGINDRQEDAQDVAPLG